MAKFLLFIPLPTTNAPVAEQLVRSAVCFLETQGKVERAALGEYTRTGRKDTGVEMLKLVELKTATGANDAARGKALEGVLRSTLTAACVEGGEVRVFVATD